MKLKLLHELLDQTDNNKLIFKTDNGNVNLLDFRNEVEKSASFLETEGIKKGDRVLIISKNKMEVIQLLFSLSKLGAISAIVDPETNEENLDYILKDYKPSLVFADEKLLEKKLKKEKAFSFEEYKMNLRNFENINVLNDIFLDESEPILFIYTSGSTGKPKAVVSSHKQILFCTKVIAETLALKEDDVIMSVLPFSFDYGLYQIFLSVYVNAELNFTSREIRGLTLIDLLSKSNATVFPSMPHLTHGFLKLYSRKKNTSLKLRLITNTGEEMSSSLTRECKRLLPDCEISLMYGLTECKRVSILKPNEMNKYIGSVGKPLLGTKCFVVDASFNILPANETGELIVIGPNIMNGYWNSEALTREKFITFNGEKALVTGDYFKIDQDGYLYYQGRKDDMYKNNGYRIYAKEIEETVVKLDGVDEVCLVVPDKDNAEACLFYSGNIEKNEIKQFLLEKLEAYKIPKQIIKLAFFETTLNGKIDKNALKKQRNEYAL